MSDDLDPLVVPEEVECFFSGLTFESREPVARTPQQTWEEVKAANGWVQLPGETVCDMDLRIGNGRSVDERPKRKR